MIRQRYSGGNREFDLRRFHFNRDFLFCLLQAFDVAANGVFRHFTRIIQVTALRDQSRQRWDCNCVAAVLVGLEESRVFVDFACAGLHARIIAQPMGAPDTAAAILRVALEMGSLARFFRGRMRVRGSVGSSGTFTRNGSRVILRKVTPWRAAGNSSSEIFVIASVERRCASSSAFAWRLISTAGNCHMREKSTLSCAPGSWISRVRPRGSRRIAAAIFIWTGARLRRGAGILLVRPWA